MNEPYFNYHACLTGDCGHDKQIDCAIDLLKEQHKLECRITDLAVELYHATRKVEELQLVQKEDRQIMSNLAHRISDLQKENTKLKALLGEAAREISTASKYLWDSYNSVQMDYELPEIQMRIGFDRFLDKLQEVTK